MSTRSSIDLDFSIEGEIDEAVLATRTENTPRSTFAEAGYVAFDINVRSVPHRLTGDLREFWGGFKIDFKVIEQSRYDASRGSVEQIRKKAIAIGKRGSTKFRIDISEHEYCKAKRQYQFEELLIYVHSPEMIAAEKLRAICQQMPVYVVVVKSHSAARARDFVDIHTVCQRLGVDVRSRQFQEVLMDMFQIKRVPLELIGKIKETRSFHSDDFISVRDTVKPGIQLEKFDFYFDFVVDLCDSLESLWNE